MELNSRTRSLGIALAVAPVTAVVCTAASWIRLYLTGTLELQPGPAMTWMSGSASAALAVLGACCIVAYRNVEKDDLDRVLKCSLVIHGCLLLAIPLQDADFFVYLGHGALVAHGFNPHLVGAAALGNSPFMTLSPWKDTPSPYGPVATFITAIGGVLGKWTNSPIWVSGVAYKLIAGSLDLWSLFVASAVARNAATTGAARGFAAFALNPLLAWAVAAQAHNDGLIILSSLMFLWALQRDRDVVAAVALTLGTMTKFVLGPLLALYLLIVCLHSMRRALLLAALSAALCCALLWPWWPGIHALLSFSQPVGLPVNTIHSAASIHWVIFKLQQKAHISDHTMWRTYQLWTQLGWGSVLALFLVLTWRASRDTLAHVFAIVLLSIIATVAWLMNWYFLWPLPFAIVEAGRRWQRLVLGTTVVAALASGPGRLVLIQPPVQLVVVVALLGWRAWSLDRAGTQTVGAPNEADQMFGRTA